MSSVKNESEGNLKGTYCKGACYCQVCKIWSCASQKWLLFENEVYGLQEYLQLLNLQAASKLPQSLATSQAKQQHKHYRDKLEGQRASGTL